MLQLRVVLSSPHGLPPYSGCTSTEREAVMTPPPQNVEQALHKLHSERSQFMFPGVGAGVGIGVGAGVGARVAGQGSGLHDLVWPAGQGVPSNSASCTTIAMRV